MYCKWGQDVWVRDFFGAHVGRCLEIGAKDGQSSSQTLGLIESGWHAVLVEPHDVYCQQIKDLHTNLGTLDRCKIVNAAIVPDTHQGDTITMYDYADPAHGSPTSCSSISRDWAAWCGMHYANESRIWETVVPCMTLGRLLDEVGMDFDFVTIDAEGQSLHIAAAMPWDLMPTRLLSIEGKRSDIAFMQGLGWHCREIIDVDLLLTR